MVEEFNKTFKKKEDEEEKSVKTKKIKEKTGKGKISKDKDEVSKKTKKSSRIKEMESPKKKIKTEPDQVVHESDKKTASNSNYGHFELGDKPKRIVHAKKEIDCVVFTIEWLPRKNGKIPPPPNTQMTNLELREYDKDLLLDFYEARLKFIKPSTTKESARQSTDKDNQKEGATNELRDQKENLNPESHEDGLNEQNQENEVHMETNGNDPMENEIEGNDSKIQDQADEEQEKQSKNILDLENLIDNNGQTMFAELGFNTANDFRDLSSNLNIISRVHEAKLPSHVKNLNTQYATIEEKSGLQDLQLESPKEISDNHSQSETSPNA